MSFWASGSVRNHNSGARENGIAIAVVEGQGVQLLGLDCVLFSKCLLAVIPITR
jgi:hypothetical protein